MQNYLCKSLDELWAMSKEERAEYSRLHTQAMEPYSRTHAFKIYSPNTQFPYGAMGNPKVDVIETDTVSALFNHVGNHNPVCILNFASYCSPGGGFMNGAKAQEEALCYVSNLYNILSRHVEDYYTPNSSTKNRGILTNRALYTTNISFFRDNMVRMADVLTCAAPKKQLCLRYHNFTEAENSQALQSRVLFMRRIIDTQLCDTVILGAWGCGVFKQDPIEVASLFKQYFSTAFVNRIIYAIPGGVNYKIFKQVLGNTTQP